MPATFAPGAPGIYHLPAASPPALSGVRLDVCAFVGVAPRGPARVPLLDESYRGDTPWVGPDRVRRRSVAVPVESWGEYARAFGRFEGPGRLPFAVSSFFEQGGSRAYIVRIVADTGDPLTLGPVAKGRIDRVRQVGAGDVTLVARNEGSWGNGLRTAMGYTLTPLTYVSTTTTGLVLDDGEGLPIGSLLRLDVPGAGRQLRYAIDVRREPRPDAPGSRLAVVLDSSLAAAPDRVEIVEGVLALDDGDGRRERHAGLGLSAAHPRWAATVLCLESELVEPDPSWSTGAIGPNPGDVDLLPMEPRIDAASVTLFSGGEDHFGAIVPDDFFDARWVNGDPEPGDGVHALVHLSDLASVAVPDLYDPKPLAPPTPPDDEPSLAGADFAPCVDVAPPPVVPGPLDPAQGLTGLALDPRDPADLATIVALQSRLVGLADDQESFVVLLDVPPGLSQSQILRWRSRFDSSYAAAYHPWLRVSPPDDGRDAPVELNPSAAAAGIIARQEHAFGVPHGPANVVAEGVFDVDDRVSPARHDDLHSASVNVFLRDRDGVVLTAARTLSRDARYRQLSVRRLMMLIRRSLAEQMPWAVFEPINPELFVEIREALRSFLRRLYRAGAFRGASEDEAFAVRCDLSLNPSISTDLGRVIAEIQVAPAEPLEFLLVQLVLGFDGITTQEG